MLIGEYQVYAYGVSDAGMLVDMAERSLPCHRSRRTQTHILAAESSTLLYQSFIHHQSRNDKNVVLLIISGLMRLSEQWGVNAGEA